MTLIPLPECWAYMCGSPRLVYVLMSIEPRARLARQAPYPLSYIPSLPCVCFRQQIWKKRASPLQHTWQLHHPKPEGNHRDVVSSNCLSVGQTSVLLNFYCGDTWTGSTSLFSWQGHSVKTLPSCFTWLISFSRNQNRGGDSHGGDGHDGEYLWHHT